MVTSDSPSYGERPMGVLLVANYETDKQESMQRFANVLFEYLPRHGVRVHLCRPKPFFGRLHASAFGSGKWLGYADKFLLFPFVLKRRVRDLKAYYSATNGAFLVHICDHSNAMYTRHLRSAKHVVTCNDMLAIRSAKSEIMNNVTSWSGQKLQAMILRGLNRAEAIACISEATRGDLLRLSTLSERRVRVIHMGQNYGYRSLPRSHAQTVSWEKLRGGNQSTSWPAGFAFLLHVGGNQWYKNRVGLLKIYALLREQLIAAKTACIPKLVMIGPNLTRPMEQIVDLHPGLTDDIMLLHDVDNKELQALYSAAELLLFPSLEEGFGWPVIEAQACGCRVVTTGKPPMTEVGGASVVYLNPEWLNDHEGRARAAQAIRMVLGEGHPAREARIRAGLWNAALFTTEKMIGEYVQFYKQIVY